MSIDPKISEYFRNLNKKRKNPYTPFKKGDSYASDMGKLGGAASAKAKKENSQTAQEDSRPDPQ